MVSGQEEKDSRLNPVSSGSRERSLLQKLVLLIVAFLLLTYLHDVVKMLVVEKNFGDFAHYYFFSQQLSRGKNIYRFEDNTDPESLKRKELIPTYICGSLKSSYSPFFFFLISPLAHLPFWPANLLWLILNHLALLACLWLLDRILRAQEPDRFRRWSVIAVIFFASQPLRENIGLGQVNLLILLGLILIVHLELTSRQKYLGGIFLAFILLLKPQFVLVFFYFLWKRKYPFCLSTFVSYILFRLAGCLLYGFPLELAYWQSLWTDLTQISAAVSSLNLGLKPVINRLFSGLFSQNATNLVFGALALALLILTFRHMPRRNFKAFPMEYSSLICLSLLVSPLTEEHHLVLLVLALVVAFYQAQRPRLNFPLLVGAFLLISLRYSLVSFGHLGTGIPSLLAAGKTLGIFLLWFLLLRALSSPADGPAPELHPGIGGRGYPFLVKAGTDSELNGRDRRVARKIKSPTYKVPAMKKAFLPLAFLLLSVIAASQTQQSSPSQSPAGRRVEAYVKAFNTGEAAMKDFFTANVAKDSLLKNPVETRLARYRQMRERLGTLEIRKVVESRADLVSVVARGSNGPVVSLDFQFEAKEPFGLLAIRVMDVGEEGGLPPDPKKDDAELAATVGEYAKKAAAADVFSGVILVAHNGRSVQFEAYGLADREAKVPNRTDTKFNIGSINKSFTSLAVRRLAAEGKINLDDPIRKYLPDYPNADAAAKVTVRHLLDMTSGIGDFFGERYEATPKEKIRSLKDYLPLFADRPLEFEPGTRNMYSNGGYVVLGLIVEKASGTDYYIYVREHIFKPAGMLDTDSFDKDASVANRAVGYTGSGAARKRNYDTLPGKGSSAGGGYSTAADLLKYVIALNKETFGSAAPELQGGFGIAGGAPGLNAAVEWDPQRGYAIIVLANLDPPAAGSLARQIRTWLPR